MKTKFLSFTLLLLFLLLSEFSSTTVLQTKANNSSNNSSLADYTLKKAASMGISNRQLLLGLSSLHKPGAKAFARKLFPSPDQYEMHKRRNQEMQDMQEEVENGFSKMVLDEEVNQDSEEDEEMNEISDRYMRIRDYIDKVRNTLKDQMDNMEHDMEVQQKLHMDRMNEEH